MLSERQDRAAGLSASDSSSAHIWVLLTNLATWAPRGESLADAREVGIFYALRACAPAWSDSAQPSPAGRTALKLLVQAPYGLWPVRYHALGLQALADSLACRAVPRFVPARAF